MKTLRLLYLEDQDDDRRRFGRWMAEAWEKAVGGPIKVTPLSKPEDAIDKLRKEEFDLFVVDVLFEGSDGKKEQLGFQAVSTARTIRPDLAILVISVGESGFEQKAIDAGADGYLTKTYIISYDVTKATLASKMKEVLRRRGKDPVPAVEIAEESEDLRLRALIETIGQENLGRILGKLFVEQLVIARVGYVRSGLSGACVVSANCSVDQKKKGPTSSRKILLKLARDRELIYGEYMRREEVEVFPNDLFVRYLASEPVESGGWYAIAAQLISGASTLGDWLVGGSARERDTLRRVTGGFLSKYGEMFEAPELRSETRPNTGLWELVGVSRGSRILEACEELGGLVGKYGKSAGEDLSLASLDDFIRSRRILGIDEEDVSKGAYFVWSHGDLHAQNIVVGSDERALLIDPANIAALPWPCDMARLTVDLIVRWLDSGEGSFEWSNMERWIRICKATIGGRDPEECDVNEENEGVVFAVGSIRRFVLERLAERDLEAANWWEFVLALGVEFMRAGYRKCELSAPKRVLGLLGACLALADVERLIKG